MLASLQSEESMLANRRFLDLKLLGRQGIVKLYVESKFLQTFRGQTTECT